MRYIIISPVRDEASNIELTMESVIRQTAKPILWVIVDDGSTDTTGEILDKYALQYKWIEVIHRKNRGYRAAGSGVISAFNEGYAIIDIENWDFIVKLDGDLSFSPDYFEKCLSLFADNDSLGIGGGTILNNKNGQLVVDSIGDPPFHVRGATKIYRRGCWEKISPLIQAPGWDTIDEVKANYYGWSTRTFTDIKLIQHKSTGGADGYWRNWFKNGLGCYVCGYHPIFMLGKCIKRLFQQPYFFLSAALFLGFCSGYLNGTPRIQDPPVIRYLRKHQLRHILKWPSIYG
ncbi:MAG: glycosyltransferase family A protein [Salinivirgaceae bacterium]|nr:glycosyltransferase family A protein [Salinivirgaceae bacterium]